MEAVEIVRVLSGFAQWPARPHVLAQWAKDAGADDLLVGVLRSLPDRAYADVDDVRTTLANLAALDPDRP
ncbi:DUF2795 domain-containing protein [Streptomyces sp. NPDC014735]|uniref:DUF2795 domain-containing protein n=1 Tax=unclassified Streptomyces TaxID=2593676 RepID=UPI00093BF5F8|nr:DUF2795 domain-containing protein [Streptomyces sp. CB01580]OKJ44981.1 hypothetical protein AMK22_01295 [Streptomyces sp. CB01580]